MVSIVRLDTAFIAFIAIVVGVACFRKIQARDNDDTRLLWIKTVDGGLFIIFKSLEVFAISQATYCLLIDGLIFDWIALKAFSVGIGASFLYMIFQSKKPTLKESLKRSFSFALLVPSFIIALHCLFGINMPGPSP